MDIVNKLEQIDSSSYRPDVIGFAVNGLKHVIGYSTNHNVLVTILNDGEENASREYLGSDIKKMIEELKLNR